MLTQYITDVKNLLQVLLPTPSTNLYSDALLKSNINLGRRRLAGDAEAIRVLGTLTIDDSGPVYPFTDIDTGVSATNGIGGIYAVNQVSIVTGDGALPLYSRPWAWFQQYYYSEVVPTTGPANTFAQYGQGSTGSLYVWPRPATDDEYTLKLDCVGYPIDLADDTTVEAIPFPFTLAVPFIAAWYTLQAPGRQADAELFMKRYNEYLDKARNMVTPDVLPYQSPQNADITTQNKLGVQGR